MIKTIILNNLKAIGIQLLLCVLIFILLIIPNIFMNFFMYIIFLVISSLLTFVVYFFSGKYILQDTGYFFGNIASVASLVIAVLFLTFFHAWGLPIHIILLIVEYSSYPYILGGISVIIALFIPSVTIFFGMKTQN